jgi:hypothetical protein
MKTQTTQDRLKAILERTAGDILDSFPDAYEGDNWFIVDLMEEDDAPELFTVMDTLRFDINFYDSEYGSDPENVCAYPCYSDIDGDEHTDHSKYIMLDNAQVNARFKGRPRFNLEIQ